MQKASVVHARPVLGRVVFKVKLRRTRGKLRIPVMA